MFCYRKCMLSIQYLGWVTEPAWYICLREILEEKDLKLSDYLNNLQVPLATLSILQRFGFFWTPATKTTCLQELAGRFRSRLTPDAQSRALAKNGSCIQIPDTTLAM